MWIDDDEERHTDWEELTFAYASNQACDAEARDGTVMHWVGLHHAERAKIEVAELSHRGDLRSARRKSQQVARRIGEYAGEDRDLQVAIRELSELDRELSERPLEPMLSKEILFESQRRSRGQKDFRR